MVVLRSPKLLGTNNHPWVNNNHNVRYLAYPPTLWLNIRPTQELYLQSYDLVIPAYTPPKKPAKPEPKADSKKANEKAEKAKKTSEKVAPTKGNTYVVESGDNLYYISKKFSCTVDDLMAWNGLTNSNIHPGDTLVVRGAKGAAKPASKENSGAQAEKFITYTVKQGDSLFDIAKSYKTTKEDIMKWNGLKDTKIKPGDKLKIKKP